MKSYILPDDIRGAILAYMQERPYKEVANGIKLMLDLKPIEADVGEADVGEAGVGEADVSGADVECVLTEVK
jgi:hypothetical protein